MNRRQLRLSVARVACAVTVLFVGGCRGPAVEEVETAAEVPVEVDEAKVDTIRGIITATGVVAPAPGAELTVVAPETARIVSIPKAEGEAVKAGDVLVQFDIPTLAAELAAKRANVAQASARLEAATANFNRLSSLQSQGVAAPREVEDARRQRDEAVADLEQARIAADAATALSSRTTVRAAFSGVIAKRFHNPGDFVEPAASDPVLRVIDPARLQIVASVPVVALARIVVGHTAEIQQPGLEEVQAARVSTKAVQVDPASSTADVRLSFSGRTSLAAGTVVHVRIVGEEHKNVVVIPTAAVVEDEGEVFVMVAGADNKAHKYPVALGLATSTMVEVTSGLKGGERVIVRGQVELPEGAAIAVQGK
ncbi:MAG TPA: efflux RND transporter periplasmic adaptor subunit [Vicinamibacterales bacterium]|nr:efflux RND transporter periplasmic adaptor subunit [Vicinamibacterales bacterium]